MVLMCVLCGIHLLLTRLEVVHLTHNSSSHRWVERLPNYPSDWWFFSDWQVYEWCLYNNVDACHVYSGVLGEALRINPQDHEGLALFAVTWL